MSIQFKKPSDCHLRFCIKKYQLQGNKKARKYALFVADIFSVRHICECGAEKMTFSVVDYYCPYVLNIYSSRLAEIFHSSGILSVVPLPAAR